MLAPVDERGVSLLAAQSPVLPSESNQPFSMCRQGLPRLLMLATRRITPRLPLYRAAALILPPANELLIRLRAGTPNEMK